jgi:hypothetical protein
MAGTPQSPPPPPTGGGPIPTPTPPPPGGATVPPPLTGGLTSDLRTLLHDFFAHADPSQLRADLTAVANDFKTHNSGGGFVPQPPPPPPAMSDMDTMRPSFIVGHS